MINIISTIWWDEDKTNLWDKKEDIFQELKKENNKSESDIDAIIKNKFGEYVDFLVLDEDDLDMSFVDSSRSRHVFYEVDTSGNIKEMNIKLHVIPYSNELSASEEELAKWTSMTDIINNAGKDGMYIIHKEIMKDDLGNNETQDWDESVTAYKIENNIANEWWDKPVTMQEISTRLHDRMDVDKHISDQFKM